MKDPLFGAKAAFLAADEEDPSRITLDAIEISRTRRYHDRLAHWVEELTPNASTAMKIAARCQHIMRWKIPRAQHPAGRAGYLKWRKTLSEFHVDKAQEILISCGYEQPVIDRVSALLRKDKLDTDAETKSFEDAICLVFLETELHSFYEKNDAPKALRVLQKTLKKMTPRGLQTAESICHTLPENLRLVLQRELDREKSKEEESST